MRGGEWRAAQEYHKEPWYAMQGSESQGWKAEVDDGGKEYAKRAGVCESEWSKETYTLR